MKRFFFLMMISIFVLLACSKRVIGQRPQDPNREETVLVEEVSYRDLNEYIRLTGVLEGKTDIILSSEVNGQIVEIFTSLGNNIRKGDPIARIDNSDYQALLDQAEIALLSAEANLSSVTAIFEANELLYQEKRVSEVEYQNSVASYKNAQAQLLGAQATFDQRKRTLNQTQFVSPVQGQIVDLPIKIGQTLSLGQKVAGIVDVKNLVLKTGIGENVVSSVSRGQEVFINHRNSDLAFKGIVSGIGHKPLSTIANYPLEISISDTKNYLLPGMIVSGEIRSRINKNVFYTSLSTVLKEYDENFVYIIDSENIVHKRKVTLGRQVVENIIIAHGLEKGELLVVEGYDKINEGQKVALRVRE